MPIYTASDTGAVLRDGAKECTSRTLLLERFADPCAKDEARKEFFGRAIRLNARTEKAEAWETWLECLAQRPKNRVLYAQL